MRTLRWIGIFLAVGVATLKFAPDQPQATVEECARDFSAGFTDKTSPEFARHIAPGKLRQASRVLCVELVAYDREHPSTEAADTLAAVVHEKPQSYLPLCEVMVEADLAGNAKVYRFVTKPERSRYRSDHCRLAVTYFQPNTINVDRARLAAEHPALYAPFCASLIQTEYVTAALPISAPRLHRMTRASCLEALESGAVRIGPTGWQDADIDEAGFDAILERNGL